MIDIRESQKYILRDGDRGYGGYRFLRFMAYLENSNRPVVGVVINQDGKEEVMTWHADGTYTSGDSPFDLIEEDYSRWDVDAKVLVRDSANSAWVCGYFAGVVHSRPTIFPAGRSSWTARVADIPLPFKEAKLASDE